MKCKTVFILTAVACLCVLMFASKPLAAPPPADVRIIERQQEQIILQHEERLRQQENELYQRRGGQSGIQEPELFPLLEQSADVACVAVSSIPVDGVTLLSSKNLSSILLNYENRCLTLTDINNLLRDITNAYISEGYITTRAFINPNEGGKTDSTVPFRVMVIEGKIEKIIINDGDKNSYYRGRTAFPGLEGRVLNLRDIEQGLDQLNRLPSAEATMELVPGEDLGGTVVRVTNNVEKSWRLGAGFDNSGQRSTGEGMYSLSFEKDNLVGLGDQLAVYWSEDLPFWENDVRNRIRQGWNQSLSAYVSVPYGYWTFSGNASRYTYSTKIYGLNTSYDMDGRTNYGSINAERVVHRDQDSKTALSFGVNHRRVDTYIEKAHLTSSSYRLMTTQLGGSHSRRFYGGVLGTSIEYTKGLGGAWSSPRRDSSHFAPKPEFDKISATVSYYRPFSLGEQNLYWSMLAKGQLSNETLYGAERMQIGGQSSVRGFKEDSITGDQGGYVRNEIGWTLPWLKDVDKTSPVRGLQVYGAYDVGALIRDRKDSYERGSMQGMTLGLRTLGDLSFDVAISKAIDWPSTVHPDEYEFFASVRYTF